jgi:hypothetical protein
MTANKKFDLDLRFGQEGEKWLTLLADERKIEVKRDRMWEKTGNLFIEYSSWGEPSGLFATESQFFAYILHQEDGSNAGVLIFNTERLKRKLVANDHLLQKCAGGDEQQSRAYLLPLADVGRYL